MVLYSDHHSNNGLLDDADYFWPFKYQTIVCLTDPHCIQALVWITDLIRFSGALTFLYTLCSVSKITGLKSGVQIPTAMYREDLKSGLVWMLIVEKRLGCKWSRSQMGSEIWKPNLLKSRQMADILSNHLKSRQWCPDFECIHCKVRPFEIKFWILNGQISDPHCIYFCCGASFRRKSWESI